MNLKSITAILSLSLLLCATQTGWAREKWPQPTEAAKQQMASFAQHKAELLKRLEPELATWAKKGKPPIPWAKDPCDLPQAKVPAFPGAEGGGEYSFGGRGGKIYVVTNLNDSGPGSFRAACEAAGPRIVVFNVAGVIHLKMPIYIEAPYITIAGQTAPGDGVCIADRTTKVDTHDVVIRYLRFRRGIADIFNRNDALGGNPVGNVIIDHCSCSWGGDESLSMYRHMYQPPDQKRGLKLPTVNITIQWCIISETLNTFNHALGGTWGGRHMGFHHNLFACNTGRNPSIGMAYHSAFNFVNNVLFNWDHRTLDGGGNQDEYNIINNYYKPGPATPEHGSIRYRILRPDHWQINKDGKTTYSQVYVHGNYIEGNPKVTADNWDGGVQLQGVSDAQLPERVKHVRVDQPFPMPHMTMQSAQQAYEAVLAGSGATLPQRDAVDQRVIEEVRTGKTGEMGQRTRANVPPMKGLVPNDVGYHGNGIITRISQVGGYPDYQGKPIQGLCADGIPLSWKQKYHLDTQDSNLASKDLMGDGYTVMDKYLDALDPTKKIDWSDPASNVNTLSKSEAVK